MFAILLSCKVDTLGTAQNVVPSSSSGGGSDKGEEEQNSRNKATTSAGRRLGWRHPHPEIIGMDIESRTC